MGMLYKTQKKDQHLCFISPCLHTSLGQDLQSCHDQYELWWVDQKVVPRVTLDVHVFPTDKRKLTE